MQYQQPRRRRTTSDPHAADVASSRNPGKLAVAVAAVLGSGTAEVPVTQKAITRGTRASGPAKQGRS